MKFLSNSGKASKGNRLNWPSTQSVQPVHFDKGSQPEKLTKQDLELIRQSKGKPLVP